MFTKKRLIKIGISLISIFCGWLLNKFFDKVYDIRIIDIIWNFLFYDTMSIWLTFLIIILILIIISVIGYIYIHKQKSKKYVYKPPEHIKYNDDVFFEKRYRWEYSNYDTRISNLRLVCTTCGSDLIFHGDHQFRSNSYYYCARHSEVRYSDYEYRNKNLSNIETEIKNNIRFKYNKELS